MSKYFSLITGRGLKLISIVYVKFRISAAHQCRGFFLVNDGEPT